MQSIEQSIELYQSIIMAKSHLGNLNKRIQEESEELDRLHDVLQKEYKDVLRMEQQSLQGLFKRMLGSFEEQYELEKQEYLHAALRYNECKKTLELLEFERDVLLEKVAKEPKALEKLSSMVSQRKTYFAEKYPDLKARLNSLSEQTDTQIALKSKLHATIIIALNAKKVLNRMYDLLGYINGGSDVWGFYPSYQEIQEEKKRINEAHDLSYKVKQLLQDLEDKMNLIYESQALPNSHRFDEFRHFNNFYHENLLSDWIMQKRMLSARSTLTGTISMVERIIATLRMQVKKAERLLQYLKTQEEAAIASALR